MQHGHYFWQDDTCDCLLLYQTYWNDLRSAAMFAAGRGKLDWMVILINAGIDRDFQMITDCGSR